MRSGHGEWPLQGDDTATIEVNRFLSAIEQNAPHAAEQLLSLVYDELRKLAAQKLTSCAEADESLMLASLPGGNWLVSPGRRPKPSGHRVVRFGSQTGAGVGNMPSPA
jgi:hypothetical protein